MRHESWWFWVLLIFRQRFVSEQITIRWTNYFMRAEEVAQKSFSHFYFSCCWASPPCRPSSRWGRPRSSPGRRGGGQECWKELSVDQLLNINHQRLNLPKRKNQEWVRDMPSTSLDWEELINLDSRLQDWSGLTWTGRTDLPAGEDVMLALRVKGEEREVFAGETWEVGGVSEKQTGCHLECGWLSPSWGRVWRW